MAFAKTNVKLESLTPALAQQFAAMPGLPGERPLRDGRLVFLHKEHVEGRFTGPSWAVALDTASGQTFRANGQHSSAMLCRLDPANFPVNLKVGIEEFTTDDLARDAFRIFNLFDHPRAARSNTDIMGLYRAQYSDLSQIDLSTMVALCNGVNQYESHQPQGKTYDPRQRGDHLIRPEVREFVKWISSYDNTMHAFMIGKAGVMAEAFASFKADEATAKVFWDYAFMESHPDPDHETRELTRNLLDLMPRNRISQEQLGKVTKKFWTRYRRSVAAPTSTPTLVTVP